MRTFRSRRSAGVLAIVLPLAAAACTDAATAPQPAVTGTVTVDASAGFAYLAESGDSLVTVPVATPQTSAAWTLGLFATTVTSNGGAAGPGGVEVACLCANAAATDAQVQAMTPASELPGFEAATADVVAGATFASDVLLPAIAGWYSGSGAGATVTPGRSWITREGSGTVVLGKFHVTELLNPTPASPGQVVFEFAVEPAAGQPFGATQTDTVNVAAGPVYYELTTGAVTDAGNWDVLFDGWTIRTNGGVSGTGTVRAVLDVATPFASIDAAYAGTAPPQAFSADAFSGVFAQNPWYRYNITGVDNQIWPTFNVYLVRRGTVVFAVQLISYYATDGTPRQITLRYRRIAG